MNLTRVMLSVIAIRLLTFEKVHRDMNEQFIDN